MPSPRPRQTPAAVRATTVGLACVAVLVAADGRCSAATSDAAPAPGGDSPTAASGGATSGTRSGPAPRAGAPARVTPPALSLPPALAGDDPLDLARAATLVRQARDYERRALRAPAADSGGTTAAGVRTESPLVRDGDIARDAALADSARRAYDAAAALVPDAGDWLRLRRLALEPDAPTRARTSADVRTPAAREQLPAADATARLRAGDLAGAAAALEAAGRPAAALAARARLAPGPAAGVPPNGPAPSSAAPNTTFPNGLVPNAASPNVESPNARGAVRAALLRLAAAGAERRGDPPPGGAPPTAEPPAESARRAATLLDSLFAPLAPAEQLVVARALGEARDPAARARAAAAYAGALDAGAGTPDDQLAYGRVLARAGRWRDAVAAFARVSAGAPAAPAAAYDRAHALLRAGDGPGARAALRQTGVDFPRDSAAASARLLLAELTADDGDEATARAEYLRLARELPDARLAPTAAVRAGILALAAGDARAALDAFDLTVTRWPDAPEAPAARYWGGRAAAAAGDSAGARTRWTAVASTGEPGSYYGWLAARRLGQAPWAPGAGATVQRDPAADAAARRAALCEQLGLGAEAGYERDWLARWADTSAARLLAASAALVETGRPGPGIRLAQQAVARGADRSASVWRLLYPMLYAEPLAREARAAGVDPALAAAVIKQESNFTADAVSPAGAQGLMQLMPSVGRALWRGAGPWSPSLLFRPDVNLALGMRHLDAALEGWADPAFALAAYNAGAARVQRWQQRPGASDPELFVERIPYAETRDYVRIVLRNREFYRALYAL